MFQQEEKKEGSNALMENYPFNQIIPQQSNKDNLILQTSPERAGEIIEHRWRGEVWDDQSNQWVKKRLPIMTDEGINEVIAHLVPALTQASTLGNITVKQAQRQTCAYSYALIEMLAIKGKEWGLDKAARTLMVVGLTNLVYNTFTRSLGKVMSDKELYSTTISNQEHTLWKFGDERKRSLGQVISGLNPFRRGGN